MSCLAILKSSFNPHTLLNPFEKIDKASLVTTINIGFQEHPLTQTECHTTSDHYHIASSTTKHSSLHQSLWRRTVLAQQTVLEI